MDKLKHFRDLRTVRNSLIFAIPLSILVIVLINSIVASGSQQFSLLAKAFLHGQLNFLAPIGGAGQDPVFWHGKIYWSEGLFPSVLLMPLLGIFSISHIFFYQGYIQWVLVIGVLFFIYKIASKLNYSHEDSLILALGFTLGSVFIGVSALSPSWYFAQVLTTFLLFWTLYEYYRGSQRRWWLIGIICGLVLMTRATATPIVLFFILEAFKYSKERESLIKSLTKLILPILIALGLLGLYNLFRFGNTFTGGYNLQQLYPASMASEKYGVFNPIHIPTNLFSLLLSAPTAVLRNSSSWTLKFPYITNNIYGMSIFITSPYLLYLFNKKWKEFDSTARNLLLASFISAIIVLSYFGIGLIQFGYRYSLDFLPEIFIVFMIIYRQNHEYLSRGMKFLLLGSGILNFYLLIPLMF